MHKGDHFNQLFLVDQYLFDSYLEFFKDDNPLHVDTKYALGKGFSNKVVYGNVLGGFLSYFVGVCLPIKNLILVKEELNFLKPVYIGDKLKLDGVVDEFHESVQIYSLKFNFFNQNKLKVANGSIQVKII